MPEKNDTADSENIEKTTRPNTNEDLSPPPEERRPPRDSQTLQTSDNEESNNASESANVVKNNRTTGPPTGFSNTIAFEIRKSETEEIKILTPIPKKEASDNAKNANRDKQNAAESEDTPGEK